MRLLLGVLAGLLLGLVVGVAAVAVHPWWWGLLLAVAASLGALVVVAPGAMRFSYAAAWGIVVAMAATPRPAGGYAIAGNLEGYVMILMAVVMLVVAAGTARSGSAARDRPREGA